MEKRKEVNKTQIIYGPETDKYRSSISEVFEMIQKDMDEMGLHPEKVDMLKITDGGDGKVICDVRVDLQPGRTNQTFIEWFFTRKSQQLH